MDIYKLLRIMSSESKAKIIVHFLDCKCGNVSVTSICHFAKLKQSNVSKHIMDLREENILIPSKQGRKVIYSISPNFEEKWGDTIRNIISQDKTLRKLRCKN